MYYKTIMTVCSKHVFWNNVKMATLFYLFHGLGFTELNYVNIFLLFYLWHRLHLYHHRTEITMSFSSTYTYSVDPFSVLCRSPNCCPVLKCTPLPEPPGSSSPSFTNRITIMVNAASAESYEAWFILLIPLARFLVTV